MSQIDDIIDEQSNRPLTVLHGLTPLEVLHGQLPDKHLYKNDIAKNRLLRLKKNRKRKCAVCK